MTPRYRIWYCGKNNLYSKVLDDLYKPTWVVDDPKQGRQEIFETDSKKKAERRKNRLLKKWPSETYLICKMKDSK